MLQILTKNIYKATRDAYIPVSKQGRWLPILTHFYLCPDTDGIYLGMTNLKDIKVGVAEATWINGTFEACIPARSFKDWLYVTRHTEMIELDFTPETLILTVHADNTRAEFICLPTSEFPLM